MQIMRRIGLYIHEDKDWPQFNFIESDLLPLVGVVREAEGRLLGKMEALGFHLQSEAHFDNLRLDVIKSSEIEGEILHPEEVRSSLARRLGLEIKNSVASSRDVDGVVDMLLDATQNYDNALTHERLFGWHNLLFPGGRSGMHKIKVGEYRGLEGGPMQVVSGAMGKEKVHFEAPDSQLVPKEMERFLNFVNNIHGMDPVIKAGIAHFWFVTIHPFDDGNGRMARAITDMLLARGEGISQRFYSMSAQIRIERKAYYTILERSQKGSLDITEWLVWFLNCLHSSFKASNEVLAKVLQKHAFWNTHAKTVMNKRQVDMVNKLFENFKGKLNTSKYAKMAKCSTDTALRDIHDLMEKGILRKEEGGGRSTNYSLLSF